MANNDKNTDSKKVNDKEKEKEKLWLDSEVQLLKKWGEIAGSYRLLHDKAFREFQIKSYGLTIPVIIMSTLSGTASFSISSFPESLQVYVPMVIGGINIIVGIIQTVTQFLRVTELTEAHRVASITYGKFARNITTELSLPPKSRTYNGIDFVQMCRTEMDRLIEQSPVIPIDLLNNFDIKYTGITKPEVLTVSNIVEYQLTNDEKIEHLIANVAENIQSKVNKEKTTVQKIQENINKKINPSKENNLHDNIKDIVNNVEISNIEKQINDNKEVNVNDLSEHILNKRNVELKEIHQTGVVSKMLLEHLQTKSQIAEKGPIVNVNSIESKDIQKK